MLSHKRFIVLFFTFGTLCMTWAYKVTFHLYGQSFQQHLQNRPHRPTAHGHPRRHQVSICAWACFPALCSAALFACPCALKHCLLNVALLYVHPGTWYANSPTLFFKSVLAIFDFRHFPYTFWKELVKFHKIKSPSPTQNPAEILTGIELNS